jgi:hypothetical protein
LTGAPTKYCERDSNVIMNPTRSAFPARGALAVLFMVALYAAAAASTGGTAAATLTYGTGAVTLTYGTGPSCYLKGMICGGSGVVSRKCCSDQNLTCTAVPYRKFEFCLPTNKYCIGTDSPCKPKGKKCCDPEAVCIFNPKAGLEGNITTRCEKKCIENDKRCTGPHDSLEKPYKVSSLGRVPSDKRCP